jgi:hypothetical protein
VIQAIETHYAGCRFRSRLEARWSVFFDHAGIAWEYEPQGFVIDGRPYLPDFLLTDCGTWVEVKGADDTLDHELMLTAAAHLPVIPPRREAGPNLLILGPIPKPPVATADLGWIGLINVIEPTYGDQIVDSWFGFGSYAKNLRPWGLFNTSSGTPVDGGEPEASWLTPALDPYECGIPEAYIAARSARFEHGERG